MIYAAPQPRTQTPAALAFNDPTSAPDGDSETGSGTTQQDAWLVSFIDILILLLALFVLLLTHQEDGTASMEKASQDTADPVIETVAGNKPLGPVFELPVLLPAPDIVAGIFNSEDGLAGPLLAGASRTETAETNPHAEEQVSEPAMRASPATDDTVESVESSTTADADNVDRTPTELQAVELPPAAETNDTAPGTTSPMDALLDTLSSSELRDRVEVSVHGAGVNLEISDSILFMPASAALTPSGTAVLEGLASALKAQPHPLSIEGHTDNIPIETARFPSNWELSTARATIVARQLVKLGIAATRIRAIGYADTRPLADNLTPAGRSRNRRVSLVLQIPSGQN